MDLTPEKKEKTTNMVKDRKEDEEIIKEFCLFAGSIEGGKTATNTVTAYRTQLRRMIAWERQGWNPKFKARYWLCASGKFCHLRKVHEYIGDEMSESQKLQLLAAYQKVRVIGNFNY